MNSTHVGGLGGTYTGNPIACAAALATIETFERENLAGRALELERLFRTRLDTMQASDPRIGDIRGRGAMLAIELVKPATGEPDAEITASVAAGARARGVIILTCGTYGNVIRFLPPLSISDDLVNDGLDVLTEVLNGL